MNGFVGPLISSLQKQLFFPGASEDPGHSADGTKAVMNESSNGKFLIQKVLTIMFVTILRDQLQARYQRFATGVMAKACNHCNQMEELSSIAISIGEISHYKRVGGNWRTNLPIPCLLIRISGIQ